MFKAFNFRADAHYDRFRRTVQAKAGTATREPRKDQPMPLSSPLASLLEKRTIVAARAQWTRDAALPRAVRAHKARRALVGMARARIVLRSLDAVGRGSRVDGRAVIENLGRIELGAGSVLRGIPTAVELATGPNGVLRIGDTRSSTAAPASAPTGRSPSATEPSSDPA